MAYEKISANPGYFIRFLNVTITGFNKKKQVVILKEMQAKDVKNQVFFLTTFISTGLLGYAVPALSK